MIILSHLHFDHVGGLKFFKHTKAIKNIIVSENELLDACKTVFTSDDSGAYVKSLFDIDGAIYHTVRDKVELSVWTVADNKQVERVTDFEVLSNGTWKNTVKVNDTDTYSVDIIYIMQLCYLDTMIIR